MQTGRRLGGTLVAAGLCVSLPVAAERHPASGEGAVVLARSETHFRLYQRALLPGPYGATVSEELAAPIVEYVSVSAHELDAPWQERSLDVELDVWGSATFGAAGEHRRMDGDVRTAFVQHRSGSGWLRLGRQSVAGGAARYARFDGLAAGGALPFGLGAEAYGGLGVLPRWAARPGYHQLGAPQEVERLWRDPSALPEPDRAGHWLAGGRLYVDSARVHAGLSAHEEREQGELAHRNLGLDLRLDPSRKLSLGGAGVLDLDSTRIADARGFARYSPLPGLDLEVEALHAEPALFLSRQSVLGVFSMDAYDEAGGSIRYRLWRELTLSGAGFVQRYSDGELGRRGEVTARIAPGRTERTVLLGTLSRVTTQETGYRALRNALRQRLSPEVHATVDAYHYFYDDPIRGYRASSVYASTLEWTAGRDLSVLWGTSFARTPYAAADLQAQVRLRYVAGGSP